AVEDGPFAPEEAKAKGLVDEVGDIDDARDDVKKLARAGAIVTRFGGVDKDPSISRNLVDIFRTAGGASAIGTPHVTVVLAVGSISMSTGGVPLGPVGGIGEHQL